MKNQELGTGTGTISPKYVFVTFDPVSVVELISNNYYPEKFKRNIIAQGK